MAIPVIDFSKLNGEEREKTLAEIANGCEEWGFFQLVNHGITEEVLERVKKVCTEWFKTEREEDFKKTTAVKLMSELDRIKTGQKLDNADWEDVVTLTDHNDWPSKSPEFKETMKEFRSEVKKVAEKVMEVMDLNLGLEKGYIKRAFGEDEAFYGTKVCHYPPCTKAGQVDGLRAHTDAGGVVLLFQDDAVGGLQILKDGAWIDVQPVPNAIVINTGDQIEVLSNGRYKSVWHRVKVGPNGNRRSIASFYNPSLRATIAPAPKLLSGPTVGPARYPEFVFGDYMAVYADQKFSPKEPRFQAVRAL